MEILLSSIYVVFAWIFNHFFKISIFIFLFIICFGINEIANSAREMALQLKIIKILLRSNDDEE
ncbi:Uncharacterised protein [Legionella bozemanae]|uniref:Uncharacterized protein n=1 Tax=Legionella bozemanae TaxID=447 RepID=A0A0W0RY23_LEGBO|nr:hypothetical protein Lboz_0725 [Legionella bozemanae]STO35478.1 Uncharacterised protein [Legionella bozemanae]